MTEITATPLTTTQRQHLDEQGYLVLEGVLEGDHLARVRQAAYRVEAETRDAWRRAVAEPPAFRPYGLGPHAHVVEPIVTHDDLFLDLLAHPPTLAIARAFVGPDIQMLDNALHVKPPGTPAHTRWHRDTPDAYYPVDRWTADDRRAWERLGAASHPFAKLKVFFHVDDIDRDMAPFCVVPGSHRLQVDRVPQVDDLEAMPGCVPIVGPAGTALVWNANLWHTAMHHTGTRPRRMLFFNYAHFGMKQYDPCVPDAALAARVQDRAPLLAQLLGLRRACIDPN